MTSAMSSTTPRSPRGGRFHHLRRGLAAGAAISVGAALAFAGAAPAYADPQNTWARGQFLSGSVLGADLSRVVALRDAEARAAANGRTSTVKHPLGADVLDAVTVSTPSGARVDLGSVLQLGAVGQYAQAQPDGTAHASSGAIVDGGGVTVGHDADGAYGDTTLQLSALLGPSFAAHVADLGVAVKAVAAKADAAASGASGDYSIADAKVTLTSPAIAHLSDRVRSELSAVNADLDRLSGPNGAIARAVNQRMTTINPALNLLGGGGHVTVTIDVDPQTILQNLLDGTYGDGAVSFDLESGTIRLDLAKLAGGKINSLPPNTELLSGAVIRPALRQVTSTISTIADQLVARLDKAVRSAHVTVHADLSLLQTRPPLVRQACGTVAVPGVGAGGSLGATVGGTIGGLLGGTVSGAAGGSAGAVLGSATQTLCSTVTSAVPSLPTSASVDIAGTVDGLSRGTATSASARAAVLGVVTGVDASALVGAVGNGLTDGLLDGDGALSGFAQGLRSDIVDPAGSALIDGDGSVADALTHVLSITANNQSSDDGAFTENALRVRVLPYAGSGAADVRLASATVANPDGTTGGTGGGTGGTGGGSQGGGSGNGGGTGGTGSVGSSTFLAAGSIANGIGHLATTGLGIIGLVSLMLGLLAVGAYLLRRGYLHHAAFRGESAPLHR